MNRFLKKKAADGPAVNDEALHALSSPPSPPLKKPATSRWKKSSKKEPEPAPQLDFFAALPSTDELRTSLIMPNLSARFSMLREQDDPKSLIGKASDDSVLQPRRRSRMADFGFGHTGLSDIAEVSSIRGSLRPPFARQGREPSYVSEDGYGSEADGTPGSVMSRSRPGEGNVLFGGRQKVYKIPTSGANSAKGMGKLVYEDDLGKSAFQKYRHRERDFDESQFSRPSDDSQGFDFGLDQAQLALQDYSGRDTLPHDSAKDLSHSPSLSSYDKKRSTSSTARSEARSSTAATSVASQPTASAQISPAPALAPTTTTSVTVPAAMSASASMSAPLLDRTNTKTRRLYEQGLDQHMQEQQTSAMTRLNSIQRQRTASGKTSPHFLHGAKSTSNLQDRAAQPVYAIRTQSPRPNSPPSLFTNFGSLRQGPTDASSPVQSVPASPLEAHYDESNVLTQALEPADRGKATAMGAFNKPAQAFDEQQYLERQQSLQRSISNAVIRKKVAAPSAVQQRIDRFESTSPDSRARSRSGSKPEANKAYNVFQNAVNQFPAKPPEQQPASSPKPALPDTHGTFFGNISASEDEDEEEETRIAQSFNQPEYGYGNYHNKWQPTPLQPVSEHPAIRSQTSKASLAEESEEHESRLLNAPASSRSLRSDAAEDAANSSDALDSPTLGPQSQPLNGMMHHLRQKSNQSSVYPTDDFVGNEEEEVPGIPEIAWNGKKSDSFSQIPSNTFDAQSIRDSSYANSNPWDLDDRSFVGNLRASRTSISPVDGAATRSSHQSGVPAQDGVQGDWPPAHRDESEVLTTTESELPSWQQELRRQHHRDASTATQQERDAFTNELAARRNAIRENIKSIVERDTHSRGSSPARAQSAASGPMRAFGMLRSKTSGESLAHMPDQPPKAMKMLGVAPGGLPSGERGVYNLDMARPSGNSSPRPPQMPTAQHPAFKQEGPGPSREMDPSQAERQLASSRSPVSSGGPTRSRSNSVATSGRARSRTGPYRDDLEKAMVEGHGSSAAAHSNDTSPLPVGSPDVNQLDRSSEGSRNGYFDQKSFFAAQGNSRSASSGPPAVTLAPNVYTPARPVPVANPYSENHTPPLSATSPSIGSGLSASFSSGRPSGLLRKKTISKTDISEPTLISSTSNVDTIDLPVGASLKNGMDDPPPIPPINPRRRGTRKLFNIGRTDSSESDQMPQATASDSHLVNTSPKRDFSFPSSNVVRLPTSAGPEYDPSPASQQYGLNPAGSPERVPHTSGPQRAMTAPMDGGMF